MNELYLLQLVGLGDHAVSLIVELSLPEIDVSDSFSESLANVALCALGLVVCLSVHRQRIAHVEFR